MARINIVTGAASGIGFSLAAAMIRRGDTVVLADVDSEGAAMRAKELNESGRGKAQSVFLDVRDATAVGEVVRATVEEHGRLDVMVNNAGIAVGGEMHELSLAHWDRVIDVNLRGVVHGVHAAFPVMQHQGHGHIVNTASLAGLVPAPLITPYTATKHAVVGLSLALRPEAATHGVRVTAVCPGFTDTPILDKAGPDDLSKPALAEYGREIADKAKRMLYTPDALAQDIMRGIDKNKALVVAPMSARMAWRAIRLAPGLSGVAGKFEMRYADRMKREFSARG
jgi:NAD(P)-dependent dehydrogenase (short-subunit alcohol dehydrogenase family)